MRHHRISDQTPLKTKRLLLTPLSAKELAALEEQEQDELRRGALAQMRKNVVAYPDEALWYTGWRATLRDGGTQVGLLGFHGVPEDQTVDACYQIIPAHRGNGYGEEALKALCNWAFGRENVYFIGILADEDDAASNHVLEKQAFYRVESLVSGMNAWELERPASAWMVVYMSIGLALGLSLGQSFFDNIAIGLSIGLGAGLALGASLDAQDRAARKREHPPKKLDESEGEEKAG